MAGNLRPMAPPQRPTVTTTASPVARAIQVFGPYQLMRLVGKSARTMLWQAVHANSQREVWLVLPRQAPSGAALQAWRSALQRTARLEHPHLLGMDECAEVDGWPYVAYGCGSWVPLIEHLGRQGLPAIEVARGASQVAQALAFAHDAGCPHGDVQPWSVMLRDDGRAALLGLGVGSQTALAERGELAAADESAFDERIQIRRVATQDVLALGLVMHHALAAEPALGEPDTLRAIARLAPLGGEWVRLPFALPRPVPDGLRAIANRAVDRQPQQRYQSARTLASALEGWLTTHGEQDSGPLALLIERMRHAGALPAEAGAAERVAHLALLEDGHTSELAEVVLEDLALTFEMLRVTNAAQLRSGSVATPDSPVLMVRRAVAMIGLAGVRRAALALRAWPGPLNAAAAAALAARIARTKSCARVAVRLAPAGYDPEVVCLVSHLNQLGWLLLQYHFPEELAQMQALMQPQPQADGRVAPGLTAEAASFAVLGESVHALAQAVAHHWGLGDLALTMMAPLDPHASVRTPVGDAAMLRVVAACSGELVDALDSAAPRQAVQQVASRYARALRLTPQQVCAALPPSALCRLGLDRAAKTTTPVADGGAP